jgi:hypothetical protein
VTLLQYLPVWAAAQRERSASLFGKGGRGKMSQEICMACGIAELKTGKDLATGRCEECRDKGIKVNPSIVKKQVREVVGQEKATRGRAEGVTFIGRAWEGEESKTKGVSYSLLVWLQLAQCI